LHTDVQIETDCPTPDAIGAAAKNWGRNSVSKEIGVKKAHERIGRVLIKLGINQK